MKLRAFRFNMAGVNLAYKSSPISTIVKVNAEKVDGDMRRVVCSMGENVQSSPRLETGCHVTQMRRWDYVHMNTGVTAHSVLYVVDCDR